MAQAWPASHHCHVSQSSLAAQHAATHSALLLTPFASGRPSQWVLPRSSGKLPAPQSGAAAEIDGYRGEREAEFAKLRDGVEGAGNEGADALEAATRAELSQLQGQFDANRGGVVDLLVAAATNVRPSVPEARKCPVKI